MGRFLKPRNRNLTRSRHSKTPTVSSAPENCPILHRKSPGMSGTWPTVRLFPHVVLGPANRAGSAARHSQLSRDSSAGRLSCHLSTGADCPAIYRPERQAHMWDSSPWIFNMCSAYLRGRGRQISVVKCCHHSTQS